MNSPSNQKLPAWIFILTDLALIAAAVVIAYRSAAPLSTTAMLGIIGCVGLGALVGLVPVVARYERLKNEALDDRQRALEALARTVSSSAEQISIAAGGLHEIAEIAQKNLRHAEQLPHKLQDKIAEFQAQLTTATDTEKEELERELLALRTTESERLESVSQRIAKSSAEWAKLEAATNQHLAAANEAIAKLAFGTAGAIGKAQAAAEQALAQARIEAARTIGEASGQATRAVESAKIAALADLEAHWSKAATFIVERVMRELTGKIAAAAPVTPAEPAPASASAAEAPTTTATDTLTPKSESPIPPPKRARKIRREESSATGTEVSTDPVPASPSTDIEPAPEASSVAGNPPTDQPAAEETATVISSKAEPQPIPSEKIPEITPVAPHTAEPFAEHISNGATVSPTPPAAPEPAVDAPKSPRKRAPKKPEPTLEPEAEPALGLDETSSSAAAVAERIITSDGATRLLVTAYIGIGNRVFIRGHGPGLSWEKGVPLQFVSIGKWRWETNDATAPIEFKLYKNDDLECAALGAQKLDPGHQQEVTAAF